MKNLIDLHTHTIASGHAYSSLQENIAEAKKKGLKVMGMSDHAPSLPGAPHIYYFQNLKVIPEVIDGIRILKGAEANIIDHRGNIDLEPYLLNQLDYVIASIHPPCYTNGTIEENTMAYIQAMNQPKVKILGHIDDSRFPVDFEKVIRAAKSVGCMIEINNASLHPQSFRKDARKNVKVILDYCKAYQVSVIMSSDAHISYQVGDVDFVLEALKTEEFPNDLVVNYAMDRLAHVFRETLLF